MEEEKDIVQSVTERGRGRLYQPGNKCTKTGRPVLNILRDKHPKARILAEEDFDSYQSTPDSIRFFAFEVVVAKQADFCTAWLLRYGAHLKPFCVEMVKWACMMVNGSSCYAMYRTLNAGHMLATNKEPRGPPTGLRQIFHATLGTG